MSARTQVPTMQSETVTAQTETNGTPPRSRLIRAAFGGAISLVVLSSFAGCGDEFSSCEARKICASGGSSPAPKGGAGGSESGASGAAGDAPGGSVGSGGALITSTGGVASEGGSAGGGPMTECDVTASPSVAPCMATNEHAYFVAPTGLDTAPGTREKPFKTLVHAADMALMNPTKVVIACNAAFRESLVVNGAVRLYGGFRCPGTNAAAWTYQPGTSTTVAPTGSVPALTVRDAAGDVVVEDFSFLPDDATLPGSSSIAVAVVNSSNVVFRRARITGGKGGPGVPGADGAKGADGAPSTPQQNGPSATTCPCSLDMTQARGVAPTCGSRGGTGGGNVDAAATTTAGGDGQPGSTANGGVLGGAAGFPGSVGPAGTSGKLGASTGTFSDAGFTPASDAGAGTDGGPGQGGGGGAGGSSSADPACCGGFGGAGGMGGCGGKGGGGGGGGGASIALLVWDSQVELEGCRIIASDGGPGGKGGNGGAGGKGKLGGLGGLGYGTSKRGGDGGPGGDGGVGGPGAGGMGGPSIGVVFKGARPSADATTSVTVGKPGLGGPGGNPAELGAPAGTDGFAMPYVAAAQ